MPQKGKLQIREQKQGHLRGHPDLGNLQQKQDPSLYHQDHIQNQSCTIFLKKRRNDKKN